MDKASWTLSELRRTGVITNSTCGSLSSVYREDIYIAAEKLLAGGLANRSR